MLHKCSSTSHITIVLLYCIIAFTQKEHINTCVYIYVDTDKCKYSTPLKIYTLSKTQVSKVMQSMLCKLKS